MSRGLLCFKGMTSLSVCAQVSPVQQMADRRARRLVQRTANPVESRKSARRVYQVKIAFF